MIKMMNHLAESTGFVVARHLYGFTKINSTEGVEYTTEFVAEDIKQYAKSKEVDEEDRSAEALALRRKIEEPGEGGEESVGNLEVPQP